MKLYFVNRSSDRIPRLFLTTWVRAMGPALSRFKLDQLKLDQWRLADIDFKELHKKEFGLIFLDQLEARKLNKQYRQRNYATDVLSFEGDTDHSLGELVICPTVIRQQAGDHGLSFKEELGYMVLHGVLHLLGFDHERGGAEAKQMFEIQDQVFEQLCRKVLS